MKHQTTSRDLASGHATSGHIPVMLDEVLATLRPRDGGFYLDGTFGGGGYAAAILGAAQCTLWAIDRDPDAIARGAGLAARFPGRLHLLHGNFADLLALLTANGVAALEGAALEGAAPDGAALDGAALDGAALDGAALDGIVLDLGVSSFQLDDPTRGFSFRTTGPLDMRMDRAGPTAADLVNTVPERELADILFTFGEERASRRIARAIVAARTEAPIETTARLAEIIRAVLPPDRSGIDPATRSFQALRIRVNDELAAIERALADSASLLLPGGTLVVVAFHSLEDRIVKRFMVAAAGRDAAPSRHDPRGLRARPAPGFRLLTQRPMRPGAAELAANPRARSARLRAIARVHPPEFGAAVPVATTEPGATDAGEASR